MQFTLVIGVMVLDFFIPLPKELFWVLVVATAYILPGIYFLPSLIRACARLLSKEELHAYLYNKDFYTRPMTYDEHLEATFHLEQLKRWDRIIGHNAFLWPIRVFSSHWRWLSALAPAAIWALTVYLFTRSGEAAAVTGVMCGMLGWALYVVRKPFLTVLQRKDKYLKGT